MKTLIILVLIGFAIYFLIKLVLYLYHPFLLNKTIGDIENRHDELLKICDRNIITAVRDYNKWCFGDEVTMMLSSEDELKEQIRIATTSKQHEQEVNKKFVRLRERFVGNYKKLGEAILAYERYLNVRLKMYTSVHSNLLNAGVVSFDEFVASADENKIIIEECERRLDVLLDS